MGKVFCLCQKGLCRHQKNHNGNDAQHVRDQVERCIRLVVFEPQNVDFSLCIGLDRQVRPKHDQNKEQQHTGLLRPGKAGVNHIAAEDLRAINDDHGDDADEDQNFLDNKNRIVQLIED